MSNSSDFYFTHDDKIFAENLNDTILLSNAFDLTIPVKMPSMFSNGNFVNTTEPRKCGMGIITLKSSLPSGISINNAGALTGTGTISFKFYPNFASFGCIKKLNWDNTGSITVRLKKSDNTTIINNVTKNADISQNAELNKLQEIIIEVVFSNATLSNLEVFLKNKDNTRYGANIGIKNVNDLNDDLTNLENKNSQQDSRLNHIDDINIQQNTRLDNLNLDLRYNYSLTASNYNPNIDNNIDLTVTVTDVFGAPLQNKNITLYHNGNMVSTKATNSDGVAVWNYNCNTWGMQFFSVNDVICQVYVDGWRKIDGSDGGSWSLYRNKTHGKLVFNRWLSGNINGWTNTTWGGQANWRLFNDSAKVIRPDQPLVFIATGDIGSSWGTPDVMRAYIKLDADGKIYYCGFWDDGTNYDFVYYYDRGWGEYIWMNYPSHLLIQFEWAIRKADL